MDADRRSEISVVYDEYKEENDSFQIAHLIRNASFLLDDSFIVSDDEPHNDESNFNLNDRQKLAVEWMITKEQQEPYATDMGSVVSKIAVIMSLLLKSRGPYIVNTQSEGETDLDETFIATGHTLIVCSKNKIHDKWIECYKKYLFLFCYAIKVSFLFLPTIFKISVYVKEILSSQQLHYFKSFNSKDDDYLFKIKCNRIILDNVLCVYNHKLQSSIALYQLSGICRWAFIGSGLLDDDDKNKYYGIIKYIKHKLLSGHKTWKKWLEKNLTVTVKDKLIDLVYSKRII